MRLVLRQKSTDMNKLEIPILAVKKDLLFETHEFEGFCSHVQHNLEEKILAHGEFIIRGDAEQDPTYKQPICHIAIVNVARGEVYAFQRASKAADVTETRLHGKWSLGVGGHIDVVDRHASNPLHAALQRELAEEVTIVNGSEPFLYGYINNNSVEVDRYHLGVLYILEADGARHHESSSVQGAMLPFSKIEEMCKEHPESFEYWSIIMLEPLRAYFERRKQ